VVIVDVELSSGLGLDVPLVGVSPRYRSNRQPTWAVL